MVEWYVYALITMLFFSFGNITLSSLLKNPQFLSAFQKNQQVIFPSVLILAIASVLIYLLFLSKINLPAGSLELGLLFILIASLGFICLLLAVSSGKIALVTAVVSTSSVMVALLSVVILKDTLNFREIAGVIMAFVGVLLLAFK